MRSRRFEIIVNDETVIEETDGNQFHIRFDVTIDAMGHISYCDLVISNLSDATINKFFKTGAVLGLRAGYADTIDYIFRGRIKNVFKEREGATVNARIVARGGSLDKTKVNSSLGENTKLSKILQTIADETGYSLVYTESDFTHNYVTGYSMTGAAEEYLNELAETHDFNWVVESDRLIITLNSSSRNTGITEFDMFTGLEGIPELTEVGIDFRVRLSPKLKIGAMVKVVSEFKTFNYSNIYFQDVPASQGSGTYKMFKLVHSGDNYGAEWTTKVTGYKSGYSESSK